MYSTLISAPQLQSLLASGQPCMVFDCSFDLMQPEAGLAQYLQSHIPGARYVHLDQHLSAPKEPASGLPLPGSKASEGRHPLPTREHFAAWLGSIGFHAGMQAVVYDRQGANYCGRLWWMLQWCGHEAVALLDGGLQAWVAQGGASASGAEAALEPSAFTLGPARVRLVDTDSVAQALRTGPAQTVIDARGSARFRGEVEPLDPVAGHIPGALNRPFADNLGPDGHFKPAAQLHAEFTSLLGGRDPASVVHHCGSGVSAVPNVIAMQLAGLGNTALYAGSWSAWCADPARPTAQG